MSTSFLIDSVAETTAHRDRDDLDRAIARLLLKFLQANSVTVYRVVEHDHISRLAPRARAGPEDSDRGPDLVEDPACFPALASDPGWQECVDSDTVVQCTKDDGRRLTLFPLHGEREVFGILEIDSSEFLPARDADLVRGILRILRNQLALLDYGEIDTLTGLLNRKTFERNFEKVQARTAGKSDALEPSWLGMVDIDRFKAINDVYGHLFGDEVLLLVGRLMQRTYRGTDQLYRFGGEEFVIILDHASEPGACLAFERLRVAIETHDFPQVGRVTISMGTTQVTASDTPTTCVQRADAALYHAKSKGRNNVQNFEELIASGELAVTALSADVELF